MRLARAATGRDKIVKFEGAYHGLHDSALVSVKPHAPDFGDIDSPTAVPGGLGVPKSAVANVLIATFNDKATDSDARQQVLERLRGIQLPDKADVQLAPLTTPSFRGRTKLFRAVRIIPATSDSRNPLGFSTRTPSTSS